MIVAGISLLPVSKVLKVSEIISITPMRTVSALISMHFKIVSLLLRSLLIILTMITQIALPSR